MARRSDAIRKLIPGVCAGALCAGGISVHAQTAGTPVLAFIRITNGVNGEPSNNSSTRPSMSASGGFVAYESDASNLVSGDTNGARDIFVYDRATRITTRDNLGPGDVEGNSLSFKPAISGDGRYVTFVSNATNLISGVTFPSNRINSHIYLRDRIRRITTLIDRPMTGAFDSGFSGDPAISGDGRYVAFTSTSGNLVADDTNGCQDVFVADTITGAIERASVSTGVDVCDGASGAFRPSINRDGRYVAFDAEYLDPTSANGRNRGIWIRDRLARVTALESVATDGARLPGASVPTIGGDGRFLAWTFRFGGRSGTYVRDRAAGVTDLLSVDVFVPQVSPDAAFVSFVPVGNAPHGAFVLDIASRTLVPVAPEGADMLEMTAVAGNAFAVTTKVALVPQPANYFGDVYVATVAAAGAPGAPRNLASSVSGNTLTLSWAPPANGAPSTYVVAAGSQPGRDDDAIIPTGSSATSWSANVSAAGTFYIRVHATNGTGTSPPSNEVAATFGTGIRPPSNLAATVDGSTVRLTWSFPPLGSAAFNSFVIEAGSSSGSSNLARITVGTFSTTYVATGVAAGTYFVRVRSSSNTAVSDPSNEIVVVVR